jgi:two-component system, OmpR family, sensor kinase
LPDDTAFARLVTLACHDLRTPLATVNGFARTLERGDLPQPEARYVEMITAAAGQMGDLLELLGLAARIESGRYEPTRREVDTVVLARAAAEELGEYRVVVSGSGGTVEVDPDPARRAVTALARCALRHGGLDDVELHAGAAGLRLTPVTPASAPVLLGDDLRDLGAAVAVRVLRALGGEVSVEGETAAIALSSRAGW